MYTSEIGGGGQLALFSRRSSSISATGRRLVFGSLAFVTIAISLGFALRGAWPVLPFAGLECLALYLAYRWLRVHEDDCESITVAGEQVIVQTKTAGSLEQCTFNRAWVQVVVESTGGGRSSLFLRSHGRQIEVGRMLTESEKVAAARRLRRTMSQQEFNKDQKDLRGNL